MGSRVWRIYKEWRATVPDGVTVGASFAPYPSLGTEVMKPPAGLRRALLLAPLGMVPFVANWYYGAAPNQGIRAFASSVETGADVTVSILTRIHQTCPQSSLVLAGYSQGAMAIHQALVRMATSSDLVERATVDSVAGVFELADGDRLPNTPARRYGTAKADASGIRTYVHNVLRPIPSGLPSLIEAQGSFPTAQICMAGDIVCDTRIDSIKQYASGVQIHSNYDAGNAPVIKSAVAGMRQDVNARIAASGTHLALTLNLPQGQVGQPYAGRIVGNVPVKFRVIAGSLPAGLTMQQDGSVTGTPASAGTFGVTVEALDASRRTIRQSQIIAVAPPLSSRVLLDFHDGFTTAKAERVLLPNAQVLAWCNSDCAAWLDAGQATVSFTSLSGAVNVQNIMFTFYGSEGRHHIRWYPAPTSSDPNPAPTGEQWIDVANFPAGGLPDPVTISIPQASLISLGDADGVTRYVAIDDLGFTR